MYSARYPTTTLSLFSSALIPEGFTPGSFSNSVSLGIRYTVTPLTTSRGVSACPRSAMTLTLKPFAASVNASFRTRVSAGKQFSTNISTLPAYSFIVPLLVAGIRQHAHEIDDAMAVVEASERLLEFRGPLRDDNHFGTVNRAVNRRFHQA